MIIDLIIHNGRGYSQMTPADLLVAGVPQSAIDQVLADERVKLIKSECGKRIYAIASDNAQKNLTMAAAVIGAKSAAARSSAETATLTAAGMAVDWVSAMRSNIAALAADAGADFYANASWPDCPPEVMALAAQF